jgi:hypothetical protein
MCAFQLDTVVKHILPLGALMAESTMTPAVPLLDYRQSRYAQRLLRRPKGSGEGEVILTMTGSDLAERLRAMTLLAEGEEAEESFVEQEMVFPGSIMPEATEEEARAESWSDAEDTAWTDGSRLEDGRVGCSVVWEVETVSEVVEDGCVVGTSRSRH